MFESGDSEGAFDREVLASEKPVIVDFWAPWRGPCLAIAKVLDKIAAERADELKVVKVNVDEEPGVAARFGISSIPTIVLFVGGRPVAGTVGARGKSQLRDVLGREHGDGSHRPSKRRGLRWPISRVPGHERRMPREQ